MRSFYLALSVVAQGHRILLNSSHSVCSTEQECHLTTAQVDNPHHLDQNPGYNISDKGAASCNLTFAECEEAMLALDWNVTAVVNTTNANLPAGCYRQQEEQYRDQHNKSSYLWYFNTVDGNGQPDSNSEPICRGKAKRGCLCVHSR